MNHLIVFLGVSLLTAICGYLLGSINCAIIIGRLVFKKDIRTLGSRNAGMTNVMRCFGKKSAIFTLLGDIAKGILAVLLGRLLFMLFVTGSTAEYGAYIGAVSAVAGHMFPIYFGFKGGKGVATVGGAIIALNPIFAMVLLVILLVVIAVSKMVSLGSIIAVICFPIITLLWHLFVSADNPVFPTICTTVIAALVIWGHRENIKRIAAGKENKIGKK
jgi:acyl-phosphate glycerol 3-phosphate acyltransferase